MEFLNEKEKKQRFYMEKAYALKEIQHINFDKFNEYLGIDIDELKVKVKEQLASTEEYLKSITS